MYPGGIRQDSSNPDPIIPWTFGLQMTALNFQSDNKEMALCHGKFSDNGGCGYILKPKYLIDPNETGFNPFDYETKPSNLSMNLVERPKNLIITIISAQFLSRSHSGTTDVPDSYVKVSTHGVPCDHQVRKTKVVENNGLDPIWKEEFQFQICFPELCLVLFRVYDHDVFSSDDQLGYFCLPMTAMQTGISRNTFTIEKMMHIIHYSFLGYRHMRLRSNNSNAINSSLFVHVQIDD